MAAVNYTKIEFMGKSANEAFARSAAACFAAQLDPTLEELGDLKTAVSEAVTNCIVHAYPSEIGKILMKCRILSDDVFEVSIHDWGCGIEDIKKAMEPLFTTGGEDRSGMGFSIMECFMDTVKVKSKVGRGTTVTMRKKISRKKSK
jgi:stage II sporulation protein AB (anti-sigma F factor)